MKSFITHTSIFLLGGIVGALCVLSVAKKTSIVWQDNLKTRIAYNLQQDGARAASEKDWASVQHAFQASQSVQGGASAHEWDFSLPLFGWSISGLVKDADQTFWLSDNAVMAYALEQQGKSDEANAIYKKLTDKYPGKDKDYFNQVATQSLGALSSASK
ncbi:tetratricopeptide repeat protein [Dyella sp. GSA-30]|uniref:tetratricopeptide repeat protein n=1 Tax=Dyella sp. GSA-30 TaxID=2994496 RepID=UPI0024923351|nr:tetratricopeptide repeat protein [Dyella sp. GSA-30]BDU18601.1 hypothetical protein DYGSA30_00580 [Dyella sp. GSA-30]